MQTMFLDFSKNQKQGIRLTTCFGDRKNEGMWFANFLGK